jgi:NADH dehydrogenase/NADH:ubiquinone oxidoreductase subunit G
MGALTLKSFPFELRGWDIEKFESIDPTDGFGSSTRVYISKQQIVQIEPDYNETTTNAWLSDKGRQFFDSIFGSLKNAKQYKSSEIDSWNYILKSLFKTLYFFDHCNNKQQNNYFFTIVFENISIEILSLLIIISQNYSFVKIRRSEKIKLNNDLESNFQLNIPSTNNSSLEKSTLCLLIANNPRYEGYLLNLGLRQRFIKGNFKCFVLGSMIDLTFPVNFLGTKLNIIKSITEGNNLFCQDLKSASNPTLIFNTDIFKRTDGNNIFEMVKFLNYSNLLNRVWNSNVLNSSVYETGLQSVANFPPITLKDLLQFSSFYFLNLTINNVSNFKKITETKLLNFNREKYLKINKLFIDQTSFSESDNSVFYDKKYISNNKNFNKYLYLPIKMFYENEENFINTEGLIRHTSKLISTKKTKDSWKLLRNFLKLSKKNLVFINSKENSTIFYNLKKKSNFKNFITFHYNATHTIESNSFLTLTKNQPLYINKYTFKTKRLKLIDTKIKYWLDDFYIGGKDGYSQNSLILTNCSNINRSQNTNFF